MELLLNYLWLLFYSHVTKYASLSRTVHVQRESKAIVLKRRHIDMFLIFCWYNVRILNYFIRDFVYYITYFKMFIYLYLYLHCAQDRAVWSRNLMQFDIKRTAEYRSLKCVFLLWNVDDLCTFKARTKLASKINIYVQLHAIIIHVI